MTMTSLGLRSGVVLASICLLGAAVAFNPTHLGLSY
jgi:hypothetical protein